MMTTNIRSLLSIDNIKDMIEDNRSQLKIHYQQFLFARKASTPETDDLFIKLYNDINQAEQLSLQNGRMHNCIKEST